METRIPNLRRELLQLAHLEALKNLAEWDMEANFPPDYSGHAARAETMSCVAELIHERFTSPQFEAVLKEAKGLMDAGLLISDEECIVRETAIEFEKDKKLPSSFVAESTQVINESREVWVNARKNSDFNSFAPNLKKIVDLKRREAEYLGYEGSSYDALMDEYSPGVTSADVIKVFNPLKEFLVPFIRKIVNSGVSIDSSFMEKYISTEEQRRLIVDILTEIGYDFKAGRLGESVHPISTSFHPTDCPITVRYNGCNFIGEALFSAIHEAGHGMYEQGLPVEFFGTPRGRSLCSDIHESQARLWEVVIGHSMHFWRYFYWYLSYNFPKIFEPGSSDKFYKAINKVQPSLIRVNADEVTYNLHIIMRFEIEKDLIEGKIEVEDLPGIWNAKIKEYFGLDAPNDALGVLQDVHWSSGAFGYFPSYTLGNLASVQFYEAAKISNPNLELEIAQGNFVNLLNWLRMNIHSCGQLYSSSELIKRVTGEPLNPQYFTEYLVRKYTDIYGL